MAWLAAELGQGFLLREETHWGGTDPCRPEGEGRHDEQRRPPALLLELCAYAVTLTLPEEPAELPIDGNGPIDAVTEPAGTAIDVVPIALAVHEIV